MKIKNITIKSGGKVFLVGAGPGDPGLITVKGRDCLIKADVIFYDHLANPVLLNYARKKAKKIFVGKMGHGIHATTQGKIEEAMIAAARKGFNVVRLKGGDPFIFGRGGEEALALFQAGIPFEIIPGVTSAVAAAAGSGIPLTHRDYASEVVFLTGHRRGENQIPWKALSKIGTLVFYMGQEAIEKNFKSLIKAGRSPETPAAMISHASLKDQKIAVGNLKTLPALVKNAALPSPSIIVVGDVVKVRGQLSLPLLGQKIMLTHDVKKTSPVTQRLESLGAQVILCPLIKIVPPASFKPLDDAIDRKYDWFVFTSQNGVESFLGRIRSLESFKKVKIAAVGASTAQLLASKGLKVNLTPTSYNAESLALMFQKSKMKGKRVLFVRAEKGREELVESLKKQGAVVDLVTGYRVIENRHGASQLKKLLRLQPDWVTFLSSSALKVFISKCSYKYLKSKNIFIGKNTAMEAKRYGMTVDRVAKEATIESLIKELC